MIDFGLAAPVAGNDPSKMLKKQIGTTSFMPPEVFEDREGKVKPYRAECVDVFSLGVVLFLMKTRNFPFSTANPLESASSSYRHFATGNSHEFWEAQKNSVLYEYGFFQDDFITLVNGMLHPDPALRMTLSQV